MDVVQSQGEVEGAERERVYLGRGLAPDTAPPVVSILDMRAVGDGLLVRARVHDRKSPTLPAEWRRVEVRWGGVAPGSAAMRWYGEFLWLARVPAAAADVDVCATDAAGNEACRAVPAGS
jgi:hypothetical protein